MAGMQTLRDKNVLVVGGAGFVGGNLVTQLLASDCSFIMVVDNLLSAERDNIPVDRRVRFCEGSIAGDEVLEHVHSPRQFLLGIRAGLQPGGRLLLTTLTSSGFDIQVLWKDSKSISPPHHLNFSSVEGMRLLFERSGYRVFTIETPGQLDVDIVANMYRENQEIKRSRFVEELVIYSDEKQKASFQDFLATHCLSSHIRVIAERVD